MTDNPRLKEFLPYQLSITSNAVSGRIALEYRTRFGLSVPEWRVMAVLGDSGALTQRDLTWMTLMDKVAVNSACKVLEERGLVSRRPNASPNHQVFQRNARLSPGPSPGSTSLVRING